jgi:serine phosphatase RsbU (regulator of sigma subunit)
MAGLCSAALARAVRYVEQGKLAELLQAAISPRKVVGPRGFEFAARYVPASARAEVGGDWYDLFTLDDGSVFFTVGDVVGHGLDAVQDMAQLRLAVRALADQFVDPVAVLERANRVAARFTRHKFATVCCGHWQQTGLLTVARAGHPYPLLRRPDGSCEVLETPHGPPLGVTPGPTFGARCVVPPEGSVLLVYTDGLVERRGEGITTGIARLRGAVAGWDGDRLDTLVQTSVESASSVTTEDDICVLALRRTGLPIPALRHPDRASAGRGRVASASARRTGRV